jgi:hypothetical protein
VWKDLHDRDIALRYREATSKTGEEAVSTLCKTYTDPDEAREAAARLLAAGASPRGRRQRTGSFAGDPDRQRKGSFADVERDVIVTFGGDAEHPRVATHRTLTRLLRAVTLDGEPADRLVDELHEGHGLVIAEGGVPVSA